MVIKKYKIKEHIFYSYSFIISPNLKPRHFRMADIYNQFLCKEAIIIWEPR